MFHQFKLKADSIKPFSVTYVEFIVQERISFFMNVCFTSPFCKQLVKDFKTLMTHTLIDI